MSTEALQLSTEQQAIIDAASTGENVLITGCRHGKSHLLRAMDSMPGPTLHITASTGIAAVNVGGRTINSWMGIGLADADPRFLAANLTKKGANNIRSASRLAIDEVSMISAELFDKCDRVCRIVRERDQPWGGIQLFLFGDFLQLPPVVRRGADIENRPYFAFEAEGWKTAGIKLGLLTKVFRQKDAEFSAALNQCRFGRLTPEVVRLLKSRYQIPDPNPELDPVIVHTTNVEVNRENEARLDAIEGDMETYIAQDGGTVAAALKSIQDHCLAPAELNLKVGARVMLLCNLDVEEGLANGSLGKVTGISKYNGPKVAFDNGEERYIEPHTWEVKESGAVLAWRKQIPLRLAWAITTHKSQGMTLDKIRVHLANVFEFGQAYVAISRARTAEGLFIADSSAGVIRAHPKAVHFYETAPTIAAKQPTFTLQ